jgi:uncharacterized cupin superfamily protein
MPEPSSPAIDPVAVPEKTGTRYPEPFRALCAKRRWRALGDALGLKNFGVNLVTLPPGAGSSQRHWHTHEDEFVYLLEGELVLVTNAGEQTVGAGMAVGFPAGRADGHHFINRSDRDAVFLCVGDRQEADECRYPDVDMDLRHVDGELRFTHKDGTPY